jgi:hypothetical protein
MLPLHRNGTSSIVASVFVAMRTCLATHCLAIDIHATMIRNVSLLSDPIHVYL